MLGKRRTNPMVGKLSELFISGNGITSDGANNHLTSPRSPLEYKIQSPRGLKNYDLGGVGLGIVVALNKSTSTSASEGGHEILAKYPICSTNFNRSDPIPNFSGKNCPKANGKGGDFLMEGDSLENYTYVTRNNGPNNTKSCAKVYYDGGDQCFGHDRIGFEPVSSLVVRDDFLVFPTSEFLSSCNLCMKKLHGKDIYMYRGEKAFCGVECRSRQIMIDERKEQCRSEVPRSADVASTSYNTSPIFSTGILAI